VSDEPFTRNVVRWAFPREVQALPPSRRWLQVVPLVAGQAIAVGLMLRALKPGDGPDGPPADA
jgi:hypothetical protein